MSNDVPPPGGPSGEPDPFEELLHGLRSEQPEPELPPTEAMPTVSADELPPTEAMPTASADGLPPTEAMPAADAPTVAFGTAAPTAATTAFDSQAAEPDFPFFDTPTEATGGLGAPPLVPPADGSWSFADEEEDAARRRKILIWILVGLAALLVVALAVLLTVLALGREDETPAPGSSSSRSATPSQSATPSATPTALPSIDAFTASTSTVECAWDGSGVGEVLLDWTVSGGENIAIAGAADFVDATEQPIEDHLEPTMTGYAVEYPCSAPTWTYTLTMIGTDGEHRSASIPVSRNLAPSPAPSPTQAPPQPSPTVDPTRIDFFEPNENVSTLCAADADGVVEITFKWATRNATSVSFGVAGDPVGGQPVNQPATDVVEYECSGSSPYYLVASGPGGDVTSSWPN